MVGCADGDRACWRVPPGPGQYPGAFPTTGPSVAKATSAESSDASSRRGRRAAGALSFRRLFRSCRDRPSRMVQASEGAASRVRQMPGSRHRAGDATGIADARRDLALRSVGENICHPLARRRREAHPLNALDQEEPASQEAGPFFVCEGLARNSGSSGPTRRATA
jgi:hypothetical protein